MRRCVVNQNKRDATGDVVLLHDQCETSHSKLYDCAVTVPSRENVNICWCFDQSFTELKYKFWKVTFLTLNVGYFANQNSSNMEK